MDLGNWGLVNMVRGDSRLSVAVEEAKADEQTVEGLVEVFKRGNRRAYNHLVRCLKIGDAEVERALWDDFCSGDGLVTELICQSYYPFVESLCAYKFKERSEREISELTDAILADFVRNAKKLSPQLSLRNQLYQRVCAKYVAHQNMLGVNSFGHEVSEPEPLNGMQEALQEVVPLAVGASAGNPDPSNVVKEPASVPVAGGKVPSDSLCPQISSDVKDNDSNRVYGQGIGLSKPRHSGGAFEAQSGRSRITPGKSGTGDGQLFSSQPLPVAGDARLAHGAQVSSKEQTCDVCQLRPTDTKPVTRDVVSSNERGEHLDGDSKPGLLPPPPGKDGKKVARVAGYPSQSQEARAVGLYCERLSKALTHLSNWDFVTYKTIVLHYFKRYSYQQLCQENSEDVVTVGTRLYRGLAALGRGIMGN